MLSFYKLNKNWKYLSLFTVCISSIYLILNVGKQSFVFKHPIVCFMAMGIFLFIYQANFKRNKIILEISKCSWRIYLIHPLFINITLKVLKIDLLSGMLYLNLFIFAVIIFAISFLTTYILRKITMIKYIF